MMQPLFIRVANLVLLVVILVGVPSITGRNIGWLRLSDSPTAQKLTLWGLALAAAANGFGVMFLARGGKAKKLCWQWLIAFVVLFTVEYLLIRHYINFNWLKDLLLWMKGRMPGGNR